MKKIIYSISLILGIFSIESCKREPKADVKETIISAEDNSSIENEFVSMFDVSDDVVSSNTKTRANGTILPSGATVSFIDSLFNDGNGIELIIDFGPLKNTAPRGLLCLDGRYRAGKLHIKANRRYTLDSCNIEVWANDTDEYHAGNDHESLSKITGNLNIFKVSSSKWNLNVSNAKVVNERGTITWQSQRVIEKTVDDLPGILNDEFKITGSATGVNRNGENFEVTINEPLLKKIKLPCARTFIAGKVTVKNLTNDKSILIDFDPFNNKACDITAKATVNNREFYFTVR